MNRPLPPGGGKPGAYKQIDLGKAVVLNDSFITENHSLRHAEAIVEKTMQNAESAASHYIEEAQAKAAEIIKSAEEEAQRIVTEQADAVLQQGFEKGFEAGFAEGQVQAGRHCMDQIDTANAVVQAAYQAQARVIETCREDMLALMHSIMAMVLAHELHFRPEYLAQIVHQAVVQIEHNGTARVIVNPETLRGFKEAMKENYPVFCKAHHLTFTADAACPPHQAYLETVEASYNISPDEQAENYLRQVAPLLEVPEMDVAAAVTHAAEAHLPPAEEVPEPEPEQVPEPELTPDPEAEPEPPTL